MYKINDTVYLYLRGTNFKKLKELNLNTAKFGKIISIKQFNDDIKYTISLYNSNKVITLSTNPDINRFTFMDINELINIIMSLDIDSQIKDKYMHDLDNILNKL